MCKDPQFGFVSCSDNGQSRCGKCGAPIYRVVTHVNGEIYDVREAVDFAMLYRAGRADIRYYARRGAGVGNDIVKVTSVTARIEDTRGNFIANVA